MHGKSPGKRFSPAIKTGTAALLLSLALLFVKPGLAAFILLLFLLLCLAAPFFPCFSFFLPIICRGRAGTGFVALTFDDSPSPESTPILLDLLARHGLQATFFVVGEKAEKHPELVKEILAQGHFIGNHSLRHDPLLMLRSADTLQADIHATQEILKKFNIRPLVFRPPAGITNPHLGKILDREGLIAVNYSCRALDRGNRTINNLAKKILNRLKPGDIIMLHDLPPYQKHLSDYWKKELDRFFTTLKNNFTVVSLEELLGCPVMKDKQI
jgi:peptidoglycan/xylan/chitin deacetylase (PgdA/CDA1 family)